jgi:hypothetical protein
MAYKGKYNPINPSKYRGDTTNIIYRSLLERRFMVYCDSNSAILWWASEELSIPYVSPVDGKWHRYFVDFVVGITDKSGKQQTIMVEIKPYRQCVAPKIRVFEDNVDRRKRDYRQYARSVKDWGVNSAKWTAAEQYCKQRGWTFKLVTDKDLKHGKEHL